jgi:hypothetical protein
MRGIGAYDSAVSEQHFDRSESRPPLVMAQKKGLDLHGTPGTVRYMRAGISETVGTGIWPVQQRKLPSHARLQMWGMEINQAVQQTDWLR